MAVTIRANPSFQNWRPDALPQDPRHLRRPHAVLPLRRLLRPAASRARPGDERPRGIRSVSGASRSRACRLSELRFPAAGLECPAVEAPDRQRDEEGASGPGGTFAAVGWRGLVRIMTPTQARMIESQMGFV